MVLLGELVDYLDKELQVLDFDDYCFNGLQIEGKKNVSKVVAAVSASLDVIQQAAAWNADLLIVHHGIFWNKDAHPITGVKKKKIQCLMQNDISLCAYHLPLDAHQGLGNNWVAAKQMSWECLEPFFVQNIALGVKARFPVQTLEDFCSSLERYYQHDAHVALGGNKEVGSVVLLSGGGHREILRAVEEKVDCFVTGSFDEPIWNIAMEEKMNFFAMGHAATERVGPKALMNHVASRFDIESRFIEDQNPF